MKHGDIYWVTLPDRGGREQRGRRPAIIWQDTDLFPALSTVLLIPLTSRLDTLRFGGTLLVQPSAGNGLASPSVALVFQLGACDVRRLDGHMGRLEDTDLSAVRDLIMRFLKLA